MSEVVVYDPITNYVVSFNPSANTPDYEGKPNTLINPVLPERVSIIDLIHDNGSIREMTTQEKLDRDAARDLAEKAQNRANAEAEVDDESKDGVVLRAFMLLVLDEINILRSQHGLAERTPAQLKNAMKNKIQSGNAD